MLLINTYLGVEGKGGQSMQLTTHLHTALKGSMKGNLFE
jgi:hypothetical protein